MRIVIVTNVLASALFRAEGPPGQILDLILDGVLEIAVDDRILAEYREVLRRPRLHLPPDDVRQVLDFIEAFSFMVAAQPLQWTLPDRDDEKFVEVARSSCAEFLVTGNLRHFPDISEAVSPRSFLDALSQSPTAPSPADPPSPRAPSP